MSDTAPVAMIYTLSYRSLKTIYCAKDHKCRQHSLAQRLHRWHHRGGCLCRMFQRWCTARCSLWSPPTAAGSPRFPPMSDCRSRRQFQTSRAWQQRSYLNNVCVGQGRGTERTGERERGRTSITATTFSKSHMQRGRCTYKEDKQTQGKEFMEKQEQSSILHSHKVKTFF